jgi:hypothetical protein
MEEPVILHLRCLAEGKNIDREIVSEGCTEDGERIFKRGFDLACPDCGTQCNLQGWVLKSVMRR